jgi:hypothetical protein
MNESRPFVHKNIDDEDSEDINFSDLIDLYPETERPSTPRPKHFGFDNTLSWALTMPQLRQSYQQKSGRWARHLSRPRLVATTELLSLSEAHPAVYLSPPSPPDSIDLEDEWAFVYPSSIRRDSFLDGGEEESDDDKLPIAAAFASDYPPCTQPIAADPYGDKMFTNNVWYTSPNLALTYPTVAAPATLAPAARFPDDQTLEAYEIEIHSMLTFMLDCMNNGCLNELPELSNDLHWMLSALADFPGMAVLSSLGAVVEILVERLVASTRSCTSAVSF